MSDPTDNQVAAAILELCERRGLGKTICPSEVARFLAEDADDWRQHLRRVRKVAVRLAREGQISIYRKGRVADPDNIKGVIRLGLTAAQD